MQEAVNKLHRCKLRGIALFDYTILKETKNECAITRLFFSRLKRAPRSKCGVPSLFLVNSSSRAHLLSSA